MYLKQGYYIFFMYFRKNNISFMKGLIKFISVCILISIVSCKGNNEFTLSGELNNKKEKSIYAIYDDPIAKVDTISVIDGEFEYKFNPDTITLLRLINDSGIAVPIFADKGWEVKFKGSFANPNITGNGPNNDMQKFRNTIKNISDSVSLHNTIKTFIMENRQSYASAYIINDFFIQHDNPEIEEIEALTTQLDGHVKDCRIIDVIQKSISENKNKNKSEYINYFSSKDRKGKYVSWSNKNECYTLVNIWASWNENSKILRDSLYKQTKLLPKDKFRVLNISLDFDKKEWNKLCKKENEQWIETCDFKGWKNQVVEQMKIADIPYNILVTNNRKIIGKSLFGNELIDKVKTLVEKDKDK